MTRHACRRDLPEPRVFADYNELPTIELDEIDQELARVSAKFGTQSLTLLDWTSILGEEYGEVCRAINEEHFNAGDLQSVYEEAIQVAAVAVHIAAVIREANE